MEEKKFKSGTEYHLQKLSNYYTSPINLEKDDRVSGTYAWLGILSMVLAYDVYAIKTKKAETLTRSFWRLTDKPLKSIFPIAAWTALSVHLLLEKNIRKKKFGTSK
jgi:hypothetical protein